MKIRKVRVPFSYILPAIFSLLFLPQCGKNLFEGQFGPVSSPVFSPTAGVYNTDQNVTISTETPDALICYTDDGSTPACNAAKNTCSAGTQYTAAIAVAGDGTSKTIKAMACSPNYSDSTLVSATIMIDYGAVSTPQFTPIAGTYTSDQNVAISTTPADAVICYTDNGSTPSCNADKTGCTTGTKYTAPVPVTDGNTTLKALACKATYDDSTVASASYTINDNPMLVSSTPGDTATGVDPASGTITLVFSENMDTSQTTHTLTTGIWNNSSYVSTPNTGTTFTWENATTLKIQFSWVRFPEGSQIQWTLAKDNLKDTAGNALVADITKTFTTKSRNTYFPIADTGQTGCYYCNGYDNDGDCSDSGEAWTEDASCSQSYTVGSFGRPQGQDGHYVDKPLARSFTGPTQYGSTSDYTTTDNVTGLVWKSCTEGQSGNNCQGTGDNTNNYGANSIKPTWYNAVNQCAALNSANSGAGYAGRKNWRLPTRMELRSIANNGVVVEPAIDISSFPATVAGTYWSASTYSILANAWDVGFSSGYSYYHTKTNTFYVRCVSSPATFGTAAYTDNGDGTVSHYPSNLVWQKCSMGQNADAACSGTASIATWPVALGYCENLNLASRTDWRLPSVLELESITDTGKINPTIDSTVFPRTVAGNYWSASTPVVNPVHAWYVSFYSGVPMNDLNKTNSIRVRCVAPGP